MNITTLKARLQEYEAVYLAQGQEITNLEARTHQAKADRNAQAGAVQILRSLIKEDEATNPQVTEVATQKKTKPAPQ